MRQSGRTTAMLKAAAEAAANGGKVLIVAPNHRIRDQIVMMARGSGYLGPVGPLERQKDFITTEQVLQGRTHGLRDTKFFFDHTVQEMLTVEKALALSVEVHQQQMPEKAPEPRWSFASF